MSGAADKPLPDTNRENGADNLKGYLRRLTDVMIFSHIACNSCDGL